MYICIKFTCILSVKTTVFHLLLPGFTVRFEQAEYTFMEDAGSVQVCALVTGGTLSEALSLTLYTEDATAHGIVIEHCCSNHSCESL